MRAELKATASLLAKLWTRGGCTGMLWTSDWLYVNDVVWEGVAHLSQFSHSTLTVSGQFCLKKKTCTQDEMPFSGLAHDICYPWPVWTFLSVGFFLLPRCCSSAQMERMGALYCNQTTDCYFCFSVICFLMRIWHRFTCISWGTCLMLQPLKIYFYIK